MFVTNINVLGFPRETDPCVCVCACVCGYTHISVIRIGLRECGD